MNSGDTKCIEIDNLQQTCNKLDTNLQQKSLTNGEWLRGLSDEELVYKLDWDFISSGSEFCDGCCHGCVGCQQRALAWLRAEHKGVDE